MKQIFSEVLRIHRERYPDMQPQDYGKLIFQSEFGAEHMMAERKKAVSILKKESGELPEGGSPAFPEAVGGGFCRFPLSVCTSSEAVELLADLFLLTAENACGSMGSAIEKIRQAKQLPVEGIKEWMADWQAKGCPPVRHSALYRSRYRPHYRLLRQEYAEYFPVLLEIRKLIETGKPVCIGIDGRCGSGKTYFAGLIQQIYPCNIIHMDDFYLPLDKRSADWKEHSGGNIDFARMRGEIITRLQSGGEIFYRPYDCRLGRIMEERRMPKQMVTVIEGSYSHHPFLAAKYDRKIFLTCSKEEQRKRLTQREGDYAAVFERQWIPMEESYFGQYGVEKNSDFCIDTDMFFERGDAI